MDLNGVMLGGMSRPTASAPVKTPELRKGEVSNAQAAEDMEALFVTQLLKEMRKTVPDSGLLSGGKGEEVMRSMQDEAMGKAMAARGDLGLGRQLLESLNRYNPVGVSIPEQTGGPNGTE